MSQNPQNFQPPPMGYMPPMGPPADPQAPPKRAGALMIAIGGLGLLTGTCCLGVAFMPLEQMMRQQGQAMPKLPPNVTMAQVIVAWRVVASVIVAGSVLELALGFPVRRGNRTAIVTAMTLSVIGVALLAIYAMGAILVNGASAAVVLLFCLVLAAVLIAQFVLLGQARRASATLEQARANYQAQYFQYLQQQQAYQQPPPSIAPAPPPPPGSFGQAAYNAPAAGGTTGPAATGWQWPPPQQLTPPPPPPPPPAAQEGDAPNGQGPQT